MAYHTSRGLADRDFGLVCLLAGPGGGISVRTSFQDHRLSIPSSFRKAERADGGEKARYGCGCIATADEMNAERYWALLSVLPQ